MKVYVKFSVGRDGTQSGTMRLKQSAFEALAKLCPPAKLNPNVIPIYLEEGSPLLQEVLRIIEDETGLRPKDPGPESTIFRGPNADEFSCSYEREFEPSDYRNSEYFMIRPWNLSGAFAGLHEDGRIVVHRDCEYRPKTKLGQVGDTDLPGVNSEVKAHLGSAGFEELYFLEVPTKPPRPEDVAPIWSLHSKRKLPRLRNLLSNGKGKFEGDPINVDELLRIGEGLHFSDGSYLPAQPEYSRSELEAMGPFAIAEMPEWFGGWTCLVHPLVCTQRFRKELKKLRIQDRNLLPVRLVD